MLVQRITLPEHILSGIRSSAKETMSHLGLNGGSLQSDIFCAIDKSILDFQQGNVEHPADFYSVSQSLGCLWGEHIVRCFDWSWCGAVFNNNQDSKVLAVSNLDGSLAIYPLMYLFGCLTNDVKPSTALAFALLAEPLGQPRFPAGSMTNLMEHVNRIVP